MPGSLFIADATRRQLGQLFGAEHASLRAAHRRQTRIVLMGLWIAEIHQDTVAHVTYGRFPRAMGRSQFDGGNPRRDLSFRRRLSASAPRARPTMKEERGFGRLFWHASCLLDTAAGGLPFSPAGLSCGD